VFVLIHFARKVQEKMIRHYLQSPVEEFFEQFLFDSVPEQAKQQLAEERVGIIMCLVCMLHTRFESVRSF
jgi:hypothetical protein